MLCDVCGEKDASVFLTQIVEGKMQKVNLCEACSKAKGVNDPTGFALADLLLGLGAAQQLEKSPAAGKCPVCGFTQADFKKTGRLGCSECYVTFADGLSGMLANMHKGTSHVGKAPGNRARLRELTAKMKTLQADLDEAVASEKYEDAARLRDEIRQLEMELIPMKLSRIIANTGEWLSGDGPNRQIVVSSRIRLARNLTRSAFPGWAKRAERLEALGMIRPAIESLDEMREAYAQNLTELTALERQVLVERHLISREHAAKGAGSAVVINAEQTPSFMINEEDHLRMQSIRCGLQLREAYATLDKCDTELATKLEFAYHEDLGFLTACPTNVGTGMRASAMLHLPALVMSDQINKIINSVNKIGLAVRGLHGEGTEAMGNLFQVSNQTTLGESEEQIIDRLNEVIVHIVEHEENARQTLIERRATTVLDQIGRAYGVLCHAHSMTSKEALNFLSILKLGVDLGLFPEAARATVDELFIETQPAHLQKGAQGQKMTAEARDALRATLIRAKLKQLPEPDTAKVPVPEATKETDDE